jgi:hypothetical protein
MLLVSNRDGGKGGFDIWKSTYGNGTWSAPVNLGDSVNTTSDEYRPVLFDINDFENRMMVFSSNRPGGKGGFDIYYKGVEK